MRKERDELTEQIHEIMWHSRGSLPRDDAWALSVDERRIEIEAIKKRIKATESSGINLL